MSVIDHGTWVRYKPKELPEGAPPHAMFCKRESDGVDWYEYVNSGKNFKNVSVKLTVMAREVNGPLIISAPTTDPTTLFPAGHRVIEIEQDHSSKTVDELITHFANKIIDVKTGEMSDAPPPRFEDPMARTIEKLVARIAALEAKQA
jgi:hypothetical protein